MDLYSPSDSSEGRAGRFSKLRSIRHLSLPESLLRYFSPSERFLLYALTIVFGLSAFALLASANAAISVTVPSHGGSLVEGAVGPVRFVNPLLTLSQADEDLAALVFSGLMRALPDGSLVPDLAESYTISDDGLIYTFSIRSDATFHDGTRVTSLDVVFTVQEAQNPEIKSTHRADWEGVAVSAPDSDTVQFTLPRAYAPFLQNTTLGILPAHLWKSVTPIDFPFNPLNTNPVGSGPYLVDAVETDSTGAVMRYELESFEEFNLGSPYLRRIVFRFYPNESTAIEALNAGRVDAFAGMSPENVPLITRKDMQVITAPLPRTFGIFFNQSQAAVLTDASVRSALDAALDKTALVRAVLGGYGVPLRGPIPPGLIDPLDSVQIERGTFDSPAYTDATIAEAREILESGGWRFDDETGLWLKGSQELTFRLSTVDSPALVATAERVAAAWRMLGVPVNVQLYTMSDLNTNVIRPREYDAILFGEIVGRELDLFAFWHSSQRTDPGLNLALYANSRADSLLSEARSATDPKARAAMYREFASIVENDHAAVFLFAPEFIYVVSDTVRGIRLAPLTYPGERFLSVYQWYADTENIWHFLVNDETHIL
jgi:peptide/nickel transport system substrate-binding protein